LIAQPAGREAGHLIFWRVFQFQVPSSGFLLHTLQLVYNLLLSLKLSRGHTFFSLTSLDFAEVYPLWSFWLAAPWKSFGVGKPMEPLHGCVDLRERIHSESDCHDGLSEWES